MSTSSRSAKPTAYVAYGVFCYAAFLAASAYAIGFVGNYWAVFGWEGAWFRSLDGRAFAPLGEAVLVDVLLIAAFGVQHSAMARRSFKEWWARFVPRELERSTFVLASSLCLALLFWQWRPIGFLLWDVSRSKPGWVIILASLVGWAIVVRAAFLIDHAELFGLRQTLGANGSPKATAEFKTPGLYRAVRHPLYFGFLLAFWAAPVMTVGHLLFAVGLTVYVLVAVPLEERDLLEQFGDRYRDYQKRVRALLPLPRAK
jgi:protein-S-isoprenylcysteine O-methyltransferase Ste14